MKIMILSLKLAIKMGVENGAFIQIKGKEFKKTFRLT